MIVMARRRQARTKIEKNAQDFEATLRGVEDLDVDDIENALEAAATVLLDAWKPRIPIRTGQLAESPVMETQQKNFLDGVLVAVGPDEDGWYFHFVELGTVHSSAQPSLRPAFDSHVDGMADMIARRVDAMTFGATES